MVTTATDDPEVKRYLRELELAAARLPRRQAKELTAQIRAHLDDALDPSSPPDETAEVLRRLGTPAELVAEQEALLPTPNRGLRRVSGRLRVVRRRTWIILGMALVVIVPPVTLWVDMATAPLLRSGGGSAWWYARDGDRATQPTFTFGQIYTSLSVTSARQTGLVMNIYNPSGYTEKLVSTNLEQDAYYGPDLQVAAATSPVNEEQGPVESLPYSTHASIPPHHWGYLRVLWTPDACEGPGTAIEFTQVQLGDW
jgi:hypothetical protein